MAKKPNYGFQKQQKEQKKQKKREEKEEKKRLEGKPPAPKTRAPEVTKLDAALLARIDQLCEEGWERWERFDREVRQDTFHPFVAADYGIVRETLASLAKPGLKFLEWGSATGVITIMADMLGFEAYGIELDEQLVREARELARSKASGARFAAGSFLPEGYRWATQSGDGRLGTIGEGPSGYLQLGVPLDDFDVVFAYPWSGEEPIMLDLMRAYGRSDALFLLNTGSAVKQYRGGKVLT